MSRRQQHYTNGAIVRMRRKKDAKDIHNHGKNKYDWKSIKA